MQAVILFDGVCNLCNSAVQFVIERDQHNVFKFAALQSKYATENLANHQLKTGNGNSFVLLQNGKVYEQSTAALKVAKELGGFWCLFYFFIIIPPFLRDGIYNFIAKNRYKWFGKQESCWLPTPALRDKFYN